MKDSRTTTWPEALRAVALAAVLVCVVLIAGANFVLVEVRLLGLAFDTRLSWALLVALAAGVLVGVAGTRIHAAVTSRRKPREDEG